MQTYHIHINGIVQGVGFRPLVYQLATALHIQGYVKNSSDGLHVFFNAHQGDAEEFFENIQQKAPVQARITSAKLIWAGNAKFHGFDIVVEGKADKRCKKVLLLPDKALCPACKNELYDVYNRRYRYPFITCTQCGPRYSIINTLPYERHGTSMRPFTMCEKCNAEYNDVNNRRFFSQTNSCGKCGITLSIWQNASTLLSNKSFEVLGHINNFLQAGKIIAVKGTGGYLLLCDANLPDTIQLLRSRKQRPAKPFAVLYPTIKAVEKDFELFRDEKILLESEEAPIVLVYPNKETLIAISMDDVAPGLNRVGVMLPYSPLLELISSDYGKPLIATSANISGSPIIFTHEEAHAYLFGIADYVLSYNRDIVIPQDDSVVQVANQARRQIILRRSRGYAPAYLQYVPKNKDCMLATGAFLKSSFTLAIDSNVFISQFLGSGESYESQQMYIHTLQHLLKLYNVKPAVIVADKHPGYFTHQYALEMAVNYKTPIHFIQHHEAHFAAVLAENNLLNSTAAVLGVIWDGTGFGNDGNIWGGEFFTYQNNTLLRCYHFDYYPVIAGDKMALEPRIALLCSANDAWPQLGQLKEKFTAAEWNNYQSLIHNTKLFSSSVGRLFDAAASLLDICDKQSYEGEAAMYLQVMAEAYVREHGYAMDTSYFKEASHYYRIPTASFMQGMMQDIATGKTKDYIAAKFHYSLVCLVGIVASNVQVQNICFSGGVFQNALLVDWLHHAYKNKYQLYFHKNMSPNDENISFGQMVYHDNGMMSISNNHPQLGATVLDTAPTTV